MATEACCQPAPAAEHIEEGTTSTFAGLDAYVNPGPANATSAVVFISDVFGYDPPLLRKLADRIAANGYFAVVPDVFHGDPFVAADPKNPMASVPAWVARHDPTELTDVKAVIKQLRKQEGIEKIGVCGFCWGGKMAITLANESEPLIQTAVLCHPSLVNHEEVRSIKVPTQFLLSEIDIYVPPEKAAEFKDILTSRPEVESFLKVFPGMKHGWCIRYDVNVPEEVKSAHEAHDDMLEWFSKHLTV
ncbi:hypothetical protein R1flu_001805 [Riccia fluitans]|uniref:Dienelactone hydrolase domain-containing protein n=1 Tax=Riccia fluitans TaxID=41844 RepID=A0ABD1Y4B7_9MARC